MKARNIRLAVLTLALALAVSLCACQSAEPMGVEFPENPTGEATPLTLAEDVARHNVPTTSYETKPGGDLLNIVNPVSMAEYKNPDVFFIAQYRSLLLFDANASTLTELPPPPPQDKCPPQKYCGTPRGSGTVKRPTSSILPTTTATMF